jgi:hypothetical protein
MTLLLLLLRLLAATAEPARETVEFRLYKFQQPIGIERVIRVQSEIPISGLTTFFPQR